MTDTRLRILPPRAETGQSPAMSRAATHPRPVIACAATPGKHEAMAAYVLAEATRLTTIPVTTRIFTAADLPELQMFAGIPRRPTYPVEIYARLLIPFHLPPDTRHLLYLDTDTRPRADLAPLFDPYAPWAAHPTHCIAAAASLEKYGLRPQSGVLLIDAPEYRSRHTPATLARLARTLAADPAEFPFQDESVIHRLGWTLLPPTFNARALWHSGFVNAATARAAALHTPTEILHALHTPTISHPY